MKKIKIEDICQIEDGELRSLTRYEYLMARGQRGGFQRTGAEFRAQVSAADPAKSVVELRIAQINVIEQTVAGLEGKALRSEIARVAAKHQRDAAELQAIQAACDKITALEKIVPADESDDLGPSLWDRRMAAHKEDRFYSLAKSDRFAKLILAYSTSIAHHLLMKECAHEPLWVSSFDHMIACRDRLHQAVATIRDYAADTKTAEWIEPERGHVSPVQEVAAQVKRPASFASREGAYEWLLEHLDIFEASTLDWLDRYYREPDEVLDKATLDGSCQPPSRHSTRAGHLSSSDKGLRELQDNADVCRLDHS
ncbi:hypothetical protein HFN60_30935 [Rhizobium leguminosarum]|uniref:hypothetical protein n=1 Tax=Rhizobium leguminosarum TaxID=384 RepID=UPI001C98567F|nr:hypothetical protein [Rhizobium leguminosarum]MBY5820009.1 hypothetical protein [Rhizobium leguminosarum]